MCTLIVLHRCVPGRPLVVAANRDEFLARPAEDLAIRQRASGLVLSPLDLEAGGTWVGLSASGVFAGLTNLRPLANSATHGADDLRSRGDVVMSALEADSAAAAAERLAALPEAAFNPFQLLVADAASAWLVVYRDAPRTIPLEAGPHIVGNVEDERVAKLLGTTAALEADALQAPSEAYAGFEGVAGLVDRPPTDRREPRAVKLERIRGRVERLVHEEGLDLFEGLARVCREHEDEDGIAHPFEATCVHIRPDDHSVDRYGTRSSLLLELSEDPGSSRLWATDGPPCRRPYENRSSLLKDLGLG